MEFSYNLANLPKSVEGADGASLAYSYLSDDSKWRASANEGPCILYRGSFVYEDDGTSTRISSIAWNEGRISYDEEGDYCDEWYIRDHLGSIRAIVRMEDSGGTILELNEYLPFGTRIPGSIQAADNRHRFGGKEEQRYGIDAVTGTPAIDLGLLDFGARYYDPFTCRWTTRDPLAGKYHSLSPYNYCAGNPVCFIDPTGMEIEEDSLKEWGKLKHRIENRRDKLQSNIDRLYTKAETKGWSPAKLAGKIGNIVERIASLNSSLRTMGRLEESTQVYRLSHTSSGENGGVTLNTSTNVIDIKYGHVANFVHEMTHAGQFETGDIAFSSTGMSLLQDVYDEIAAYKAQFGYRPSSVSGLSSTSTANSFDAVTPAWVQGLRDSTGGMPYAVGGSANTGLIPININSNRDALMHAYPLNSAALSGLPANYNLRSLPGIYYKR